MKKYLLTILASLAIVAAITATAGVNIYFYTSNGPVGVPVSTLDSISFEDPGELYISPSQKNLDKNGGIFHLYVETNKAWKATVSDALAITLSKYSGTAGYSDITVKAEANGEDDPYYASVTITLIDGTTQTLYITVNGAVQSISLDRSSATLSPGKTLQLTATTEPYGATVTWSSSNQSVATVNDYGIVTTLSEGTAIITASSGSRYANCTVNVTNRQIYAIYLDATTAENWGNDIAYNFGSNDENRNLWVWDNTFVGADPSGNNPFDLPEGWVCMKQSATTGWAGCGFCVAIKGDASEYKEAADEDLAALNSLAENITDYSQWQLKLAFKKSQSGVGYDCTLVGGNTTAAGDTGKGVVHIDDNNCPADGEWHWINTPLDEIDGLEFGKWDAYGVNIFYVVANPYVANGDFNLGAAYIERVAY